MKRLIIFTAIIAIVFTTNTTPVQAKVINSAADILTKQVVTTGDGLYEDEYEEGRYIFKGEQVNNYLTFNNETAGWRIVSVEPDGTIQIIKDQSIGKLVYNSDNQEGTYCDGYGCNAWAANKNLVGSPEEFINGKYKGIVTRDADINTYLNTEYYNSIDEFSKKYMVKHNYNVGGVDLSEENMNTIMEQEKAFQWNGYIGLISYSDSTKTKDWLITPEIKEFATITPWQEYTFSVYIINRNVYDYGMYSYNMYPVIYLTSDMSLLGNGTKENPYAITDTVKINYQVLGDIQFGTMDSQLVTIGTNLNSIEKRKIQTENQVCTLENWYLDKDLKTKFEEGSTVNTDLTLYGKWDCVDIVNVPNTSLFIPKYILLLGTALITIGLITIYFIIKRKKTKQIDN